MRFSAPKLIDCHHARAREAGLATELFVVEGDSAARTLNRVRDKRCQAILPMQGKPMNATKASLAQLSKNVQFAALFEALDIDLARPDESDIRYENIILLFDPDADGIHARTLMLLFFHRWMRWWLDAGRIFDAHAPQWEIKATGLEDATYAATPDQLTAVRCRLRERGLTNVKTRRFRGLGSIDGSILLKRCVDPATRTLDQLSAEHATAALEVFEQFRSLGRDARKPTPS